MRNLSKQQSTTSAKQEKYRTKSTKRLWILTSCMCALSVVYGYTLILDPVVYGYTLILDPLVILPQCVITTGTLGVIVSSLCAKLS